MSQRDEESKAIADEVAAEEGLTAGQLFKRAHDLNLISREGCNGCGVHTRGLFAVNVGMYSGHKYCRPCMLRHLGNYAMNEKPIRDWRGI